MLRHAILALLRDCVDHGYRLKQRLDDLLGSAWRVQVGQVYQTLDLLRREGLIEEVGDDAPGGHERRSVAITPQGRAELERWLARPARARQATPPVRSEVLLRLVAGGPERLHDVLERIRQEQASCALEQERTEAELIRLAHVHLERSPAALALEAERLRVAAHIAWLEHCGRVLSQADPQADHRPWAAAR